MLIAVAAVAALFAGCKKSANPEATKNVDVFYNALTSSNTTKNAEAKGFDDIKFSRSDSDIVMSVTVAPDISFKSAIATKSYIESIRQQTIANYKMQLTNEVICKGLEGMRDLNMKYRAIYYDHHGDSTLFVILPEEIVGTAEETSK